MVFQADIWTNVPNTTNSYTLGERLDHHDLGHEIKKVCKGMKDIYRLVRDDETKLIDSKDMSVGRTAVVACK